jgi:hypothetical protein
MTSISETMSQSDNGIVQAAITDAREPDEIAIEAMHSSDRARLSGCKSELAVVDSLTKEIAKAFAAKDREITQRQQTLTQAARTGPPRIDLAPGDTNVGITPKNMGIYRSSEFGAES